MPPKRLSSSEKQEILELYRQPEETTSTLASRFGVSSSTISRVLKQGMAAEEYEVLVQQKRTGVPRPMPAAAPNPLVTSSSEGVAASRRILADVGATLEPEPGPQPDPQPSPAVESEAEPVAPTVDVDAEGDEATSDTPPAKDAAADTDKPKPILRSQRAASETELDSADDADNLDDTDDISDADLDDLDDDLDEFQDDLDGDDDFNDSDEDEGEAFPRFRVGDNQALEVRPIAEAQLPRACYLVIDRAAELITRPLSDFADLGDIPSGEVEEKTLPVFDNHRVAKRFSNRRFHRIVKIPDSRLLQKTTAYLQAKGITRLLFDGQVYDLSS